ncbi:unnamed protein product [Tilletia laevis]|uniref:RRM domain-containing protein n=2 Tax=Tilletia TaxID=13289 RepID=A0A177V753_9BASI|nr:hypothetical protein CF335_g5841 [Tilletia laevis]KAE8265506.1 hypothetical protein A4X03_0g215 [Tilletia caries]KAE8201188.1 hypothetical protein CF336_g316 [Tilletia laevis]CAD6887588.1 unnamed protein product [Tilletia caries]CAD6916912.1 unnamed protein product [Tilletia laevis]
MSALDYGAPDDIDEQRGPGSAARDGDDDDQFDAEAAMQGIVNNPEVSLDELYDAQAQSANNKAPTRFYQYPAQEGIAAGQRRGVVPLRLNPAALEPVFPHELKKGDQQQHPEHDNDASFLDVPEVTYSRKTGAANLRLSALNISGIPITQVSTSRLFAYVTYFGAQPLGLEWVDDQRAIVVFAEPEAARLAFEYLCPPGAGRFKKRKKQQAPTQGTERNDNGETVVVKQEGAGDASVENAENDEDDDDFPVESSSGGVLSSAELAELIAHLEAPVAKTTGEGGEEEDMDDSFDVEPRTLDQNLLARILTPRSAHRIPLSLYTGPERETLAQVKETVGVASAEDGDGTGAGAGEPLTMLDAEGNRIPIPADAPAIYREMAEQDRQASVMTPEARNLLALRGKLHVRFALEGRPDTKERGARKKSKWFTDHGIDAGRDVVPRLLAVGPRRDGLKKEEEEEDGDEWGHPRVKEELFPDRAAPPSLARPDAWDPVEREGGGPRGARGRGHTRAVMDDLDDELDTYRRADGDEDEDGDGDVVYDGRVKVEDPQRWRNDRADVQDRLQSRLGEVPLFDRLGGGGAGASRRRRGDRERSPSRRDEAVSEVDEFGRERTRKRDYASVKGRGSVRGALAWGDDDAAAPAGSGSAGGVGKEKDDKRTLQARLATLDERLGKRLLDRFAGGEGGADGAGS